MKDARVPDGGVENDGKQHSAENTLAEVTMGLVKLVTKAGVPCFRHFDFCAQCGGQFITSPTFRCPYINIASGEQQWPFRNNVQVRQPAHGLRTRLGSGSDPALSFNSQE